MKINLINVATLLVLCLASLGVGWLLELVASSTTDDCVIVISIVTALALFSLISALFIQTMQRWKNRDPR
jgi:hypothetical protein